MKNAQLGILGIAAVCLTSAGAMGQSLLFKIERPGVLSYGRSLSAAGDVNNDGVQDLLIGAPSAQPPLGSVNSGFVEVLSGVDGSVLYTFAGTTAVEQFGGSVSGAGDVNGDGFDDVIIGARNSDEFYSDAGSAHVYSGFDGALLYSFGLNLTVFGVSGGVSGNPEWAFGLSVSGAGDVNGDGFDDVIVGAPAADSLTEERNGIVIVYSGLDGSVLLSRLGASEGRMGEAVAAAGDVDADGFDDVVAGAPGETVLVAAEYGRVYVLSGSTGSVLHQIDGSSTFNFVGLALDDASDTNGDGVPDLILYHANDSSPGATTGVRVISGLDGSVLRHAFGVAPRLQFGRDVSGTGDWNGDGFADFAVSDRATTPAAEYGQVHVYSGADGSLLSTMAGHDSYSSPGGGGFFGTALAGVGDLNGDGRGELMVSDPDIESVLVFSSVLESVVATDWCNGDGGDQAGCTNCPCGNNATPGTVGGCLNSSLTSARLEATGSASIEAHPPGSALDLRFGLTGAPPSAFCLLNSGDTVAPTGMANPCFGMGSGTQAAPFDGLRCAVVNTRRHGGRPTDAAGTVGVTTNPWGGEAPPLNGIGYAAGFVGGQTRFFQVIYRDLPDQSCMRGLNTTQAVEITFSL